MAEVQDELEESLVAAAVVVQLLQDVGSLAPGALHLALSALVEPPVEEVDVPPLLRLLHSCTSCLSIDLGRRALPPLLPFVLPSLVFEPPSPPVSFSFSPFLAQEPRFRPMSPLRSHPLSRSCGHGMRPCVQVYSLIESV